MNSKDVMGKSVVAIRAGRVVGKIRYPIVSAAKQEITGYIVDDEKWYLETKIVLFPLVRGVGSDVATVEDDSSIMALSRLKAIERQLEDHVQLIGHKVIGESGTTLGYLEDFSFDASSGRIISYKIKNKNEIINRKDVVSIGKELMIVHEESASEIEESEEVRITEVNDNLNNIFERRQMEFVLGKRLSRSVETDEGALIASIGQVVSMDTILRAKHLGKFTELVMSIEPHDMQ